MQRFRTAPGLTGLTMRDGRKIDAVRGVISVPDRYVRDATDAMKDTQLLSDRDGTVRMSGTGGKQCEQCDFNAWEWQTDCPSCGAPLPDAVDPE